MYELHLDVDGQAWVAAYCQDAIAEKVHLVIRKGHRHRVDLVLGSPTSVEVYLEGDGRLPMDHLEYMRVVAINQRLLPGDKVLGLQGGHGNGYSVGRFYPDEVFINGQATMDLGGRLRLGEMKFQTHEPIWLALCMNNLVVDVRQRAANEDVCFMWDKRDGQVGAIEILLEEGITQATVRLLSGAGVVKTAVAGGADVVRIPALPYGDYLMQVQGPELGLRLDRIELADRVFTLGPISAGAAMVDIVFLDAAEQSAITWVSDAFGAAADHYLEVLPLALEPGCFSSSAFRYTVLANQSVGDLLLGDGRYKIRVTGKEWQSDYVHVAGGASAVAILECRRKRSIVVVPADGWSWRGNLLRLLDHGGNVVLQSSLNDNMPRAIQVAGDGLRAVVLSPKGSAVSAEAALGPGAIVYVQAR